MDNLQEEKMNKVNGGIGKFKIIKKKCNKCGKEWEAIDTILGMRMPNLWGPGYYSYVMGYCPECSKAAEEESPFKICTKTKDKK